jgi:DNA replication licensing factor MCM6
VREAYTLLRQSIIHVEQDDVEFEEDAPPVVDGVDGAQDSQDVEMAGTDTSQFESSNGNTTGQSDTLVGTSTDPLRASSTQPTSEDPAVSAAVPAPAKKKMVITHDQYMSLRSLIVLHLVAAEREQGRGLEREELIDWYLEFQEEQDQVQDLDQLEYEKELITKMLKKLVKVGDFFRGPL